jgi:hypothetical protein
VPIDLETSVGQVRLLIADTTEGSFTFTDVEIQAFLNLEGGVVKAAAALALETLASNEALVSKKIRTQDLQTDGPAVAKELRERAVALRDQADREASPAGIDIVDFDPSAWWSTAELAE